MSMSAIPIGLCADDFGIAPGVSRAIADLAGAGRLTAISCMTATSCWKGEATRLRDLPAGVEIGLHITLTSRERGLNALAAAAFSGVLDRRAVAAAFDEQLDQFTAAVGREPAFLDGHLHVHELPIVRDVVAETWRRRLSGRPWIRNTATPISRVVRRPVARARAGALAWLGAAARRRWLRIGARTNADFAGVRDFDETASYRQLMRHFLQAPRSGLLIMCHPGDPDATLAAADPVVGPRRDEFDYLASGAFPEDLDAAGATLKPFGADMASDGR